MGVFPALRRGRDDAAFVPPTDRSRIPHCRGTGPGPARLGVFRSASIGRGGSGITGTDWQIAALGVGAGKPKRPITISKQTTYLVQPLDRDGYVDYLAALNHLDSQGVTPENNAGILLVRAMERAIRRRNARVSTSSWESSRCQRPVPTSGTSVISSRISDDCPGRNKKRPISIARCTSLGRVAISR